MGGSNAYRPTAAEMMGLSREPALTHGTHVDAQASVASAYNATSSTLPKRQHVHPDYQRYLDEVAKENSGNGQEPRKKD